MVRHRDTRHYTKSAGIARALHRERDREKAAKISREIDALLNQPLNPGVEIDKEAIREKVKSGARPYRGSALWS